MGSDRRSFLGRLVAGAAAAAGGVALDTAPLAAADLPPLPPPVDDKWNVAWADKITGRARGVFDSPEINDGGGFFRAMLWMNQYKEVYGLKDEELSAVLVIRHAAIAMAVNDEYWAAYKAGKALKVKDWTTRKWAERNPYISHPTPDGKPDTNPYSLDAFMKRGGTILACNLAFAQIVYEVGQREKLARAEARTKALTYLLPGVILQPSGVFGVLRAQAAGCSYIMAS
ncbi:MAG: twin-arginine translocation signal domain-containing protein [Gemmatimonadales bacterium]|nr:twin-arginine translocation signal domain-containing protein [Gemmatimonadales bacterium]